MALRCYGWRETIQKLRPSPSVYCGDVSKTNALDAATALVPIVAIEATAAAAKSMTIRNFEVGRFF